MHTTHLATCPRSAVKVNVDHGSTYPRYSSMPKQAGASVLPVKVQVCGIVAVWPKKDPICGPACGSYVMYLIDQQ